MNWAAAKNDFMPADVIRWTEPVWKTKRSRKAKGLKVGSCQLTAEVLKDEGGWLTLLIRENIITIDKPEYRHDAPPKKGAEVRRKRETVEKGQPARLLWSDESARAAAQHRT
jgi:hypothetical protein